MGGKSTKVAFLITTLRECNPTKWVYDVDTDKARAAAISIPAEYESYFAKVKQVTSTQGGREWFLARVLRMTSTTSNAILRMAARDAESAPSADVDTVLRALQYQPISSSMAFPPSVLEDIEPSPQTEPVTQPSTEVPPPLESGAESQEEETQCASCSSPSAGSASSSKNTTDLDTEESVVSTSSDDNTGKKRARIKNSLIYGEMWNTSGKQPTRKAKKPPKTAERRNPQSSRKQSSKKRARPETPQEAPMPRRPPNSQRSLHSLFFEAYTLRSSAFQDSNIGMKRGQINEREMFKQFPQFLEQRGQLQVLWKSCIGMVSWKERAVLATSVDGICVLKASDGIFPALLEIKTRTSPKEKERLRLIQNKFLSFSILSRDFNVIPAANRQQLLHHAAVFDIEHLLFVESTPGRVNHICLIQFPEKLRASYRHVLESTLRRHFAWLYGPLSSVPSTPAIGLEFGKDAIPERESILLHMEIFRMIESMSVDSVLPH